MTSLAALKQDKKETKTKRGTYADRLEDLEAIREQLGRVCDSFLDDINSDLRSAREKSQRGLRCSTENMADAVSSVFQADVLVDGNLSQCKTNLNWEISRVEDLIEDLDKRISRLNYDISEAEKNR